MSDSAMLPAPAECGLMPALSMERAVERFGAMREFVQRIMTEGTDYGAIPGTEKKTLLKPGAEKLCTFFGLRKELQIVKEVEDWIGDAHGGEPFFYYSYRVNLYFGSVLIANGDGSCNSWEKKYRWRNAERVCPECGVAAIIRGKEEYGGGWICWKKKGGCGVSLQTDDARITSQQVGRVPNPDIADVVNTVQKMAAKRALVAATLLAVNASEFFTQDMEDAAGPEAEAPPEQPAASPPRKPAKLDHYARLKATADGVGRAYRLPQLVREVCGKHQAADQLTAEQADWVSRRLMILNRYSTEPPTAGQDFALWLDEMESHLAHRQLCAAGGVLLALKKAANVGPDETLVPWEEWSAENLRWGWKTMVDWAKSLRSAPAA